MHGQASGGRHLQEGDGGGEKAGHPAAARWCDRLCFTNREALAADLARGGGAGAHLRKGLLAAGATLPSEPGEPGEPGPRCAQASIWWLLPSAVLGTACWSLITPIKPELYQQFFDGNGGTAAAVSGWADSAGYALGFASAGVVGKLSDARGRKIVLVVQKASSLLAFAALGFRRRLHNNLWYFIVGQCVMRATGPPTIYNSYLADVYSAEKRSLYFGYLWGAQTIAIAGGPMLSIYVPSLKGEGNWDLCFKLATAFALVDFLWCA
jgi:hypothetical protein